MISRTLTIRNAQGLHMRPAVAFAGAMGKYPCAVRLRVGGTELEGKSVMNLIAAGIQCGTEVEVVCDGEREGEALAEAVTMIEDGFGE